MIKEIIEATKAERGYHDGFKAYHAGASLGTNPYDPVEELQLFEGFTDGWGSAQVEDLDD